MRSENISAGLKLAIFFLLSFLLLRLSPQLSFLLAILGGISGGWIFAQWHNTEPPKIAEKTTSQIEKKGFFTLTRKGAKEQAKKKISQKRPSIFFWKNPRPRKSKSRR
ncbi:MAG TPA: hypothetical protein V6D28_22360 [Leptolyngbyaceae cyanobacterium]